MTKAEAAQASPSSLEDVRREARRQMWAAKFKLDLDKVPPLARTSTSAIRSTPAPMSAGRQSTLLMQVADLDAMARQADIAEASSPADQAMYVPITGLTAADVDAEPDAPATVAGLDVSVAAPEAPALTPALWTTLRKVNDEVNRAVVMRPDLALYGELDYWTMPLSVGKTALGDCEDYVLAKRKALLEAGVPETALSIAVVTTSWGEGHAVLLVATDKGEVVLDNLSNWIVFWNQTNYRWGEREMAGRPLEWAMAATAATGAPGSIARDR